MKKRLQSIFRDEKVRPIFQGRPEIARARCRWRRGLRHERTGAFGVACADPATGLIQINERLRWADVPPFVIRSVVFHELVHLVIDCPPPILGGPADGHCGAFNEVEATHPLKRIAEDWLVENLGKLERTSGAFGLVRRAG